MLNSTNSRKNFHPWWGNALLPDNIKEIGVGAFENCAIMTYNEYDNAQYILTIRLDTIQYDQSKNIWK